MKILMPYVKYGNLTIDSNTVFGGVERFAQLLYRNVPGIIPVELTKEEIKGKAGLGILKMEVLAEKPDVILVNYGGALFSKKIFQLGVPVVMIWHQQPDGQIAHLSNVAMFKEFVDMGGHLYFVSEFQLEGFNKVSRRVLGHDVEGVRGFVYPAFCSGNEGLPSGEFAFDTMTIGRTEPIKNPFWLHKKLRNTGLSSLVLTNTVVYARSPSYLQYVKDHIGSITAIGPDTFAVAKEVAWDFPQLTLYDLPHSEVLSALPMANSYVVTCLTEACPITVLESLSHGVPNIFVCNKTMTHGGQQWATSSDHYRLVPNRVEPAELAKVVNELKEMSLSDRLSIADMTRRKYSLANWRRDFETIFAEAVAG